MRRKYSLFPDPRREFAFWAGCVGVTVGILLLLPMFLMGLAVHYKLAGMPMGAGMLIGMGLIIGGTVATAYGLLPPRRADVIKFDENAPSGKCPSDTHAISETSPSFPARFFRWCC